MADLKNEFIEEFDIFWQTGKAFGKEAMGNDIANHWLAKIEAVIASIPYLELTASNGSRYDSEEI